MSLDEKVEDKESKSFAQKALRLGFNAVTAVATTALSVATVGPLGVLVGSAFAGGGLIGNVLKGKPFFESLVDSLKVYSGVNAVIQPMSWLGNSTFPLIPNASFIGKAARALYASTLYNAVFVASYRGATHLVDNYLNPIGIINSISDNFRNEYKRIGRGFFPAYALDANGIANIMGIPTFAWNAFPLGFYNAINPVKNPKATKNADYKPTQTANNANYKPNQISNSGYNPSPSLSPQPAH